MKNWTLRQRILASFAVIIAIMLLMVVVSYSRLLSIQSSEEQVRTDALPGLYYSTTIRNAWGTSYVVTLKLLGEDEGRPLTTAELEQFKANEAILENEVSNYKKTIFSSDDQVRFDAFERQHEVYRKALDDVLALYQA